MNHWNVLFRYIFYIFSQTSSQEKVIQKKTWTNIMFKCELSNDRWLNILHKNDHMVSQANITALLLRFSFRRLTRHDVKLCFCRFHRYIYIIYFPPWWFCRLPSRCLLTLPHPSDPTIHHFSFHKTQTPRMGLWIWYGTVYLLATE